MGSCDVTSAWKSYYKNRSREVTDTDRDTQEYHYNPARYIIKLLHKNTTKSPTLSLKDLKTVTKGAISETISGSAICRYTYDNFNRLISYQSGDTFAFYTYDAEDYRIAKQVMDSDWEKFTRYFYEGNHVVLEADESGRIIAHNTYSINLIGRTVGEEGYYSSIMLMGMW